MKKKYDPYDDLCPECGHLMSRTRSNCRFCGWSQHQLKSATLAADADTTDSDDYTFQPLSTNSNDRIASSALHSIH